MNKSKLLASTMLVSAAALMAAGSANAATLKLGGFAEFWGGIGDQNKGADDVTHPKNSFDIKHDAEINFVAEETLDNGIKVGVLFELEAGSGNDNSGTNQDGFDESFGWVKTKWGQVNLGNNDQATGYTGGINVVGPVGLVKSDMSDWLPGVASPSQDSDVDLGVSDAMNITYFTPQVAGTQLIVSYAPDASDKGAGTPFDQQETVGTNNIISGAILYGAKFGGVGVKVHAGMTHAKADQTGVATGSAHLDGHTVHTQVDFGPVSITGAYAKENLALNDQVWYGAGVIYSVTKMDKVSLGWARAETQDVQGTPDVENDIVTIGWERDVGKGIKFAASGFWAETDSGAAGKTPEGYGLVGGFALKF